jgi:hypothetical protein
MLQTGEGGEASVRIAEMDRDIANSRLALEGRIVDRPRISGLL